MPKQTVKIDPAKPPWLVALEKRNADWVRLSPDEKQARATADVRDMRERKSYYDRLIQLNRLYTTLRARQQPPTAPVQRRGPSCATRPRERRDGTQRRSTRAGPSADDGSGPPPPRLCACGCGRDISHKRADARTFDASCRSRLARDASRGPALETLALCECEPGALATVDPDGDLVCAKCGRLLGHVQTPVKEFGSLAMLMETDADGQAYRVTRPRPPARWRDWQPAPSPVFHRSEGLAVGDGSPSSLMVRAA